MNKSANAKKRPQKILEKDMDIQGEDDTDTDSDTSDQEGEIDDVAKDHTEDGSKAVSQEDEEFDAVRKEMASMPFEELHKLKEKVGVKVYQTALFGKSHAAQKRTFKRDNKNRPREMSSKRPVSRFHDNVPQKKKASRDPRFDDLSGEYNERFFKEAYSFIGDVKQQEKHKLLKKLKKEADADKKKQIEYLLNRMHQQEKADKEKGAQNLRDNKRKKKERILVGQGKKPFYLKKAEQKKLDLAEKFMELKKSGKVENYMRKKRKKNASKDRKKLPKQDRSLKT